MATIRPLLLLGLLASFACGQGQEKLDSIAWRPVVPATLDESVRERLFADLPPERLVANQVLVVDSQSGEPVAGAEVLYLPGSTRDLTESVLGMHEAWYAWRLESNSEQFLRRYGRRALTDANGRAVIEADGPWVLVARSADLYGELHVNLWEWRNRPEELRTIELAPELVLRVQLLDQQRRPVPGAALAVGAGDLWDVYYADNDAAIATVRNPRRAADGRVELLPHVAGHSGPKLKIEPEKAPDAVPLVLPPTGRVVIELRDRHGEERLRTGWGMALAMPYHRYTVPWLGTPLPDGRFAFPFVVLDRDFSAEPRLYLFSVMDHPVLAESAVAGPVAEGRVRHAVLREAEDLTVVAGRAVDAQRSPWGIHAVELVLQHGTGEARSTLETRTAEDGSFRFVVPRHCLETPVTGFRLQVKAVAFKHLGYIAFLPKRTIEPGSVLSLGEVRFERAPVLVAGTVVDAEGRPARTEIRLVRTGANESSKLWINHGDLHWLPGMRFEYRLFEPGEGQWEVWVLKSSRDREPQLRVPFSPGTEDLVVRVN